MSLVLHDESTAIKAVHNNGLIVQDDKGKYTMK